MTGPAADAGPGAGGTALDGASVRRVRDALRAAGSPAEVVELDRSARTAEGAARACGVPLGAIVKSLVFLVGGAPALALVAGDRRAAPDALPPALGLAAGAPVERADAAAVRAATGFAIGGVAPVGHPVPLPTAVDASLARFDRLIAAAGHPRCVFATDLPELLRLTGGRLDATLGVAPEPSAA